MVLLGNLLLLLKCSNWFLTQFIFYLHDFGISGVGAPYLRVLEICNSHAQPLSKDANAAPTVPEINRRTDG